MRNIVLELKVVDCRLLRIADQRTPRLMLCAYCARSMVLVRGSDVQQITSIGEAVIW